MLYPCPYLAITTDREKSEKTRRKQRNHRERQEKVDQTNEESDEELEIEAITIETTREPQNEDQLPDDTPDVGEPHEIERTAVTQEAEEVLQHHEEGLSLEEESASLDPEEVPEGRPQRNRRAPPVFTFSPLGGNPYYRVQAIAQTQPPVF